MKQMGQLRRQLQRRPKPFLSLFKRYFSFLYGIFLIVVSTFLFISFVSYDRSDPSWNTAVEGIVQNLGGDQGAVCADLMRQFLGISSLFLILALLINGLVALFDRSARSFLKALFFISLTQACVCMFLAALYPLDFSWSGAIGYIFQHSSPNIVLKLPFIPPPMIPIILGIIVLILMGPALNLRRKNIKLIINYLTFLLISIQNFIKNIFLIPVNFLHGLSTLKDSFTFLKRKVSYFDSDVYEKELSSQNTFIPQEKEFAHLTSQTSERLAPKPLSAADLDPLIMTPKPKETLFKKEQVCDQTELNLQCTYQLPGLGLLISPPQDSLETSQNETHLLENARLLMSVLEDFGIRGDITKVHPGPVVTLYELVPASGIKASRVIGLADDIARSMSALSTRIAVIPGHNAIGIELPNKIRQTVYLRELITSPDYETSGPKLPLALGKDIGGEPIIADLARMPHLLVAGTTGSGKSVAINTMILSLLYRLSPDRCRFIMIDPKMLELSVYDGIPHLLSPVVTEPKKAVFALKWTVKEMEDRYRAMSKLGVRNIEGYNIRLAQALAANETLTRQVQTGFDSDTGRPLFETQPLDMTPLSYIVVVVDEMADLMLVAGKEIEATVQRLAQMARAAGIHLIMATQRPSVDVITGTIKANFPTRISFQVTSRFDSRTILGEQGAEQLLGRGDMLYMETGGKIQRVHGPFVSDGEVERVVNYLKTQAAPNYIDTITEEDSDVSLNSFGNNEEKGDALYQQALQIIRQERKASTSFIQRHLRVGYNTAARIIEQMESEGIVSAANHVGKREVLITPS